MRPENAIGSESFAAFSGRPDCGKAKERETSAFPDAYAPFGSRSVVMKIPAFVPRFTGEAGARLALGALVRVREHDRGVGFAVPQLLRLLQRQLSQGLVSARMLSASRILWVCNR